MTNSIVAQLELKSLQYRRTVLSIIKQAEAGHTGGSLSCIDMLNVLYNHAMDISPQNFDDPGRDRYIHSKGHSVEALYTVLADKGFFPEEAFHTLNKYKSHFIGHPTRKVNGVEQNTGALGHGLAVAVGLAIGAKKDSRSYRTYVLLGDGELEEGSNWEASMSASHFQLDNLVVLVDYNDLQITGRLDEVTGVSDLAEKFRAFGYAVRSVDGNDVGELVQALADVPFVEGKPNLILAHTIKGKGVSFMEDKKSWHHKVPSDEQFALAMAELDAAEKEWEATNGNG